MRITSFKKIAAVSAIALSVGFYAVSSNAALIQIGDPVTITATATVENTIDVTVTNPLDFGQVGSMRDGVDVANMVLQPDDTFTDDPGAGYYSATPASIVSDPSNPPSAADIDVIGAFIGVDLYVDYNNLTNLANGADVFIFSEVHDNLATPTVGTGIANGGWDGTTHTTGQATTDGAGALSFNVGGTISTDTTAGLLAYPDGAYNGSVDMYLTY